MRQTLLALLLLCAGFQTGMAEPNISSATVGMRAMPGLFPLYWDAKSGKLWLEIGRWDTDFLYYPSLPNGVGSNDLGLDRGQLGEEKIVRWQRVGPKVLLVQPNYSFRAVSSNAEERQAVEQAFATSVLWGFEVGPQEGDRVLVDVTAFALHDAHGVIKRLTAEKQGEFKLDASRSAVYEPRTRSFPKNTEIEAILTFTADNPGALVRSVAPDPGSLTVHEHHSFVELPAVPMQPRTFDPRAGLFGVQFMDFSAPIGEPVQQRFAVRHRLEKDATGKIKKPIVYYLERGAPEPVRSALLEGAGWWADAFAAAGFQNGFRVELLPEDADPMDARYNVIQYVHRSTRGWSYGNAVTDPRTGEILKGHVTLGSLRARQDFLIAEGLLAPYESGKPVPETMLQMVLARLRQLAAHEVGHTLGLQHNYIASTEARASVMDYPHPLVTLNARGMPQLQGAYATGIGEWDKVAIAYGYSQFPAADEKAALQSILATAAKRGLRFITDADSRPLGGAHPQSHLWDNGTDAADELVRMLSVRKSALERFGENNIRAGTPWATLEEVLVPLYLSHRYQIEAASKLLGGLDYNYALRGDGSLVTAFVPAAQQKKALAALIRALDPATLTLPDRLLRLIPPRPPGFGRNRESFASHTGLTFDPLAAAESAANLTVMALFDPERAARMEQYRARDQTLPGFGDVIDAVVDAAWAPPAMGLQRQVQMAVRHVVLYRLMALMSDPGVPAQVKSIADARLKAIGSRTVDQSWDAGLIAHFRYLAKVIDQFRKDGKQIPLPPPSEAPPGQPI